ncbi:MAG TPA: ABC transporter permease [Candidatus Kapabacteria bacterium]|nr:ABC transporter permease [Candidatus Kapabacteria bacterium]
MNWSRIWAIARWEYLQKVRSKGFIISLVVTPLLIVLFSVGPSLLFNQDADKTKVIAVVDSTGTLAADLRAQLEQMKLASGQRAYTVRDYMGSTGRFDSALARSDRDVLAEVTDGTLVLRDSAGQIRVTYRSTNPSEIVMLSKFEHVIQQIVSQRKLHEAGIDSALYSRLTRDIDITPIKVTKQGEQGSGFLVTFFTAYAGCILLMFLVITTGQSLVRGLVEEKSNRIMEMLIGSCTPYELMWGKLLGLSGLGITQMLVWVLLALSAFTFLTIPMQVTTSLESVVAVLPLILAYMVLGYIFYAALFIGVGSLVTTEQEAQVANSYLMMLLVFPMAFSVVVIQMPDASYVRVLSHIPFLAPSLMMIRVVAKMPPAWEILSTVGVMILSTIVLVWIAGKVFRTAILMYGKRPSMGEIMRWIRSR